MDTTKSSADIIGKFRYLCQKLENNEIHIKDIPFNSLLNIISNIYDEVGVVGNDFAALYEEMLIGGMEKRDIKLLVNTIDMALNHLILLSWTKSSMITKR